MKKENFPKPAIVESIDEHGHKRIKADDGYGFYALRGSLNGTDAPVGTRGKIVWCQSAFGSWPNFKPEK